MNSRGRSIGSRALALGLTGLLVCGCQILPIQRSGSRTPGAPAHLGVVNDQVFMTQEANAEASDFVIYDHEFQGDTVRLNTGGEDHVKQIGARLMAGEQFPVLVERSFSSVVKGTDNPFPVSPNPEMDLQRRAVVVTVLQSMGIPDAEQRVIVGPAYASGFDDEDNSRYRNQRRQNNNGGLFGNFGGFMGGFGMFGGFGT